MNKIYSESRGLGEQCLRIAGFLISTVAGVTYYIIVIQIWRLPKTDGIDLELIGMTVAWAGCGIGACLVAFGIYSGFIHHGRRAALLIGLGTALLSGYALLKLVISMSRMVA